MLSRAVADPKSIWLWLKINYLLFFSTSSSSFFFFLSIPSFSSSSLSLPPPLFSHAHGARAHPAPLLDPPLVKGSAGNIGRFVGPVQARPKNRSSKYDPTLVKGKKRNRFGKKKILDEKKEFKLFLLQSLRVHFILYIHTQVQMQTCKPWFADLK